MHSLQCGAVLLCGLHGRVDCWSSWGLRRIRSITSVDSRIESEEIPTRTLKADALLAIYGLQNRDHGCALSSHLGIRDALQSMGYTVDLLVYEMRPHSGTEVDRVIWSSGSLQDKVNATYRWEDMSAVDAKIQQRCGEKLHRCAQTHGDKRYQYPGVLFAARQLHAENYVAHFLDSVIERNYALVVAVASDIVVIPKMSRADIIRLIHAPSNTLFVSGDGDYGGYTNGLYVGTTSAVSSVMKRWSFTANYEVDLKRACQAAGVRVHRLEGHSEGHSFIKVRHNGCLKKRRPWKGRLESAWRSTLASCLARSVTEKCTCDNMLEQCAKEV